MTHKTASLWKYVKTADGWRYCKPVIKSNHKIDPRRVLVKGKVEECPSGQFYLCISGRWLPVGSDPVEALKAQQRETARLAAIANGFDLPDAIKQESETIVDAIADFMDGYKIGKSVKKTTPQMQQTLNEFLAVCSQRNKRVLADLDKKDIMNFWQWALDSSPTRSRRTASNKTMRVHTFLKSNGLVFVAESLPGTHRVTLGADKGYDTRDFVAELRGMQITPHVAQNDTRRRSAVDERTTRHSGYQLSQKARKRIEEVFGWMKTVGQLRKVRHRGVDRVGWTFTLTAAVYNLVRMRNLISGAPQPQCA